MRKFITLTAAIALALALAACDSGDAEVTTTTADASDLTTTTTATSSSDGGTTDSSTSDDDDATSTTVTTGQAIGSYETISRQSTDDGEILYILISPGEYTDVSFENFLGTLVEDEAVVNGVEIFDDRAALDASLKDEADRTASELQLIDNHHLVSLSNGREVTFQGPMEDLGGFVLGS